MAKCGVKKSLVDPDKRKLITSIENRRDSSYYGLIPNYGIWSPSINEAAELIAVDMWFSGEIEGVDEPDDFDGDGRDPRLKAVLADTIRTIENSLSSAIGGGRLEASVIKRDLDDRLILEQTHVRYNQLIGWMEERNLEPGEHIEEWAFTEGMIYKLICDEVGFLRDLSMSNREELRHASAQRVATQFGFLDEEQEAAALERRDFGALKGMLEAKFTEIAQLQKQLAFSQSEQPSKADRPLHTRPRRTLLTIIAALCDRAGIDYQARGAARRIKDATEIIGAPVDDGTIDKFLKEIPDALETRLK